MQDQKLLRFTKKCRKFQKKPKNFKHTNFETTLNVPKPTFNLKECFSISKILQDPGKTHILRNPRNLLKPYWINIFTQKSGYIKMNRNLLKNFGNPQKLLNIIRKCINLRKFYKAMSKCKTIHSKQLEQRFWGLFQIDQCIKYRWKLLERLKKNITILESPQNVRNLSNPANSTCKMSSCGALANYYTF